MIAKLAHLRQILSDLGQATVAFSGGVDSALLLKVAHDTLGDRATAIIAISPSLPPWDLADARRLAAEIGASLVEVETDEIERPAYRRNDPDRCYHCKSALFELARTFSERGALRGTLCYGAIPDDLAQHRPGMRAASEHGVRAPLIEAALSKAEIREASRQLGLSNWDKPASACLASRFPYGTPIEAAALARIARCETALRDLGLLTLRARYHGELVRIELGPEEQRRAHAEADLRAAIVRGCHQAGFAWVALDLEGYRSGSADEVLDD